MITFTEPILFWQKFLIANFAFHPKSSHSIPFPLCGTDLVKKRPDLDKNVEGYL
jgi:hypothetical protein